MEQNVNRAKQLQERMLAFSADIVALTDKIRLSPSIKDQIIRSACSIGANYTEAMNASSKADFRNKIYIAKKEAAETEYWLLLIKRLQPATSTEKLHEECHHILMILQKTVNTINDQRKSKDQ